MTDHELSGSVTCALDHMKLYGLAAICEHAGMRPVRLHWTNTRSPRPVLGVDATIAGVAGAIIDHAAAFESSGWMGETFDAGSATSTTMLFAPRTTKITDEQTWRSFFAERERCWPSDPLDSALATSLGEPSWNMMMTEGSGQDFGASRWEMVPRNRGSDVARQRFVPMAKHVARRSVEQVVAELRGDLVIDDLGALAQGDSFTASGMRDVGPCDLVVAWLGLWGMVVAPPARKARGVAATPSMTPIDQNTPDSVTLPVWTKPTSLAVVRSVLNSDTSHPGVAGLVTFPVESRGGSQSSSRFVLEGRVHTTR